MRIAPIFGGRVEALGVTPLNKQITGHAIIESLAWGITRIFAPVKKPQRSISPRTGGTLAKSAAGWRTAMPIVLLVLAASVAPSQRAHAADAPAGAGRPAQPNLAFFYGANPPVDLLQAFDAVVVDPARGFDPAAHSLPHTVWIARTPAASGATPEAFAQSLAPLWQHGYRGFLLDTPAAIAAAEAIRAAHPDARLVVAGPAALQAAQPHAKALYEIGRAHV